MFKVKGKLSALNDSKVRELTVDKAKLDGDIMYIIEVRTLLEWLEGNKEPVGPGHYRPTGKYLQDETAIMLAAVEVADEVELEGNVPTLPEPEEGVIH